ncbi:DUF87 domain-containing protein [Clostridium sp. TM06-18]|nr:DUF87 domain-containing protein [Clostridium sp. TM06-18]
MWVSTYIIRSFRRFSNANALIFSARTNRIQSKNRKEIFMDKRLKTVLNLKPHFNISDSIPIESISEDGIVEVRPGIYSRTYKIQDINFGIARPSERGQIVRKFENILKTIDPAYDLQICVYNHEIDVDYLSDAVLLREAGDKKDELRADINRIIEKNLREGDNSIKRDIYLTLTIPAASMTFAAKSFTSAEHNILAILRSIPGCNGKPLKALQRLNLLHNLYHGGTEVELEEYGYLNRMRVGTFSLEKLYETGVTAVELVQPGSMHFYGDHVELGEKFARAYTLTQYPKVVTDSFMRDFSTFSFNIALTVNLHQMDAVDAHHLVQSQRTNAAGTMSIAEHNAGEKGYSANLISSDIRKNFEEADKLLEEIERRDQKLFETKTHVVIFGDTQEALDEHCRVFLNKCRTQNVTFSVATGLQENTFNSALPFGIDSTPHSRTLTTKVLGLAAVPFSSQEMTQRGGTVYGLNKITHNIITFNRQLGDNYSMLILGSSGSGKSFFAKKEILATYLSGHTDADIVIIDPQSEYSAVCQAVGGTEIIIKGAGEHHINPMDISSGYAENPIADKVSFIQSMCTEMLGYIPNSTQKTAISLSAKRCYDAWRISQDDADIPTLEDFYNRLVDYYGNGNNLEAILDLIQAVKYYVDGTDTLFCGRTNVKMDDSFVSFNIAELSDSIRPLGMLVILDATKNRMARNRKAARYTSVYIDELHLLFRNELTAQWIKELWKTGRKYRCMPCGITQDMEDILKSDVGRGVLTNTSFVVLLKQAAFNSRVIADQLVLSPQQLEFVTDTPSGEGLLVIQNSTRYTGGVIPFEDHYPEDSKLYQICQSSNLALQQ